MPEISDAELRQFVRYQGLGTPEEAEKKIRDLTADNHKYRQEEKPALESKLKTLPPEGAVVLTGDEAKAYPLLKELGKPEEVKTALAERDTLKEKDAQRTRTDLITAAVKAVGWPDETAPTLIALLPADAVVELKAEKGKDAKGAEVDIQVPYVTLPGEGQKAVKFGDLPAAAPQFAGLRTTAASGDKKDAPSFHRQSANGVPAGGERSEDEFRKATEGTVHYQI